MVPAKADPVCGGLDLSKSLVGPSGIEPETAVYKTGALTSELWAQISNCRWCLRFPAGRLRVASLLGAALATQLIAVAHAR